MPLLPVNLPLSEPLARAALAGRQDLRLEEDGTISSTTESKGVRRLLPRHFQVIDMAVQGCTKQEIANELGMTVRGVEYVLSSRLVQEEVARRREGVEKRVDEGAVRHLRVASETIALGTMLASEKLIELLNGPDPKMSLGAAKVIMDIGRGRLEVAQNGGKNEKHTGATVINIEQLQLIATTLKELSQTAGKTV